MLIQDLYDFNIYLDDLNIFDTEFASFIKANIFESISNPIPTCTVELILPNIYVDERSIVDGTIIKFEIKCEYFDIDETYSFRLFNTNKIQLDNQYVKLTLEGIIDFYDGYTSSIPYTKYATTSDIFKDIATQYNFINDIDTTNDCQLWIGGQNSIYQFLNILAQHGWINETSAMFWCIDRQRRLLYKNLTTLFRERQDNIYTFLQTPYNDISKKQFSYGSVYASLQSGTNNLRNDGYGGSDMYFDLLTYKNTEIASQKVVAESKIINVSKELSKGLSQEFFPLDVGNFNKNYYTAIKQNKRILSTYSTYLTVETQFFQPFRLAQIVSFNYTDAQNKDLEIKALSGIYIINAINIEITLQSITALIELAMQGLNGKATTREVY